MQLYFFMPEASLIIRLGKGIVFVFLFFILVVADRQAGFTSQENIMFIIFRKSLIHFTNILKLQHFKFSSTLTNNNNYSTYLYAKLLKGMSCNFIMIYSIKRLAVWMINSIFKD